MLQSQHTIFEHCKTLLHITAQCNMFPALCTLQELIADVPDVLKNVRKCIRQPQQSTFEKCCSFSCVRLLQSSATLHETWQHDAILVTAHFIKLQTRRTFLLASHVAKSCAVVMLCYAAEALKPDAHSMILCHLAMHAQLSKLARRSGHSI